MTDFQLKLEMESIENIFKSKKNLLIELCNEMGALENVYAEVKEEISARENKKK